MSAGSTPFPTPPPEPPHEPPHEVVVEPDLGIELPDGTRLSARVWRPAGEALPPLPAIVEYLPYRKADGTAERDDTMHPAFARHGYVCLRVDRRGCGDSEGLFDDEYSERELQDGVELLEWIAEQPWCDGCIGLQGISWGGFNGLQIAARRPGPLKAVISIASSVDRFADDIHYKGGVQLGENVGWATTVLSWFSMPPDPAVVGERWRDTWLERLESTPFLGREWLVHPDRDAYWRHGSVCEDFAAIEVPVLALGGQHDGYRNTVSRLVRGVRAPVKGVLGPWSHKYPHISTVGPSIDYVGLALRWWDRWLKGRDTGVEAMPAYGAYVVDSAAPDASADRRAGRWVGEPEWPSPACRDERLALGPGALGESAGCRVRVDTDLAVGRDAGEFFPFGFGSGELPGDQRDDDALSVRFDSAPLPEERVLLGAPTLELRLASDHPRAQLVARLCDVRPDGGVMLVALGLLNLRHRDGFERARDLVPGETVDAVLALDEVAYRVPAGHRLRLSLSTSYWPFCWPEGHRFALTVSGGTLSLPIRRDASEGGAADAPDRAADAGRAAPPTAAGSTAPTAPIAPIAPIDFAAPPAVSPSSRFRTLRAPHDRKERHEDPATGTIRLSIHGDHGVREDLDGGLVTASDMAETWEIERDDPASARVEMVWNRTLSRGDWRVGSRVTTRMRGLAETFELRQTLEAFEGDELVFSRVFETSAPRYESRHDPRRDPGGDPGRDPRRGPGRDPRHHDA